MEQRRQVTLLGDSILKGIQVDLSSRRYRSQNEINVGALESEFQLSIHNDAHFGATVRKGQPPAGPAAGAKAALRHAGDGLRRQRLRLPLERDRGGPGGGASAQRAPAGVRGAVPEDDPADPQSRHPSHPYQPAAPGQQSAFSTGGAGTWIRKPFSAGWGTWAISTPGRSDIPGR